MKKLTKNFFKGDAEDVAKALLGKLLIVGSCQGIIVETEAYKDDGASHLVTRKNQGRPILENYGTVYVYLNYGMYHMLNFTTNKNGPGAVLIRAVEPVKGVSVMKKRRNKEKITELCSGPGKLCEAFNIDMKYHNKEFEKIKIYDINLSPECTSSPRIGITEATELLWRFTVKGSKFLSKK